MNKKSLNVIFCLTILVAVCLLALIVCLRFTDIFEPHENTPVISEPVTETPEPVSPEPEIIPTPEVEPEYESEAEVTPEETPAPSPFVEPIPDEPEVLLHSGLREDGSFNEGTLFIGDSLSFLMITHYLDTHGYIGDAKYTCKAGAGVSVFFGEYHLRYGTEYNCLFPSEWYDMTFSEAAAAFGEDATAIYFMLGTNQTAGAGPHSYIEIIDYLLAVCPNATVHLQTVPYATAIPYEAVNENIMGAYKHYQDEGEKRVMLLDTCTAIGQNIISDGVHMNDTGRDNWYKAILAHAEENNLPE